MAEWEFVAPLETKANYDPEVRQIAASYGVDPDLAVAVHRREYDPKRWSSKAGARGPMQLMPGTAKDLGVDPDDPLQNIDGGVRYLKEQLDAHGGNVPFALAAYNAGPHRVKKFGGVPPFPETIDYIKNVTGTYKKLKGTKSGTAYAGAAPEAEEFEFVAPLPGAEQETPAAQPATEELTPVEPTAEIKSAIPEAAPQWAKDNPSIYYAVADAVKAAETPGDFAALLAGGKIGATAGGAAGSIVPGAGTAVGGLVGGMAGATLAYLAKQYGMDSVKQYLGMQQPYTLAEGAAKIPERAAEAVTAETVGPVVGKAIGGVAKTAKSTLFPRPSSKLAGGIAERKALAYETEVPLTPAQVTQKKSHALLESQLEKNIGSTNAVQEFRQEQAKAVEKYALKVQEKEFGGPIDQQSAGQIAQEGAWKRYDLFRKKADTLYDAVPVDPATRVPTENLKDAALSHFDELGKMESPAIKRILKLAAESEKEVTSPLLDSQGNPLLGWTSKDTVPSYTWKELRADQSTLGKMAKQTTDLNKKRILRDLSRSISDDISGFSSSVENPEIKAALDKANKFYKEGDRSIPGIRVWTDKQITNMMRSTSPEDIGKNFFKARPNTSDIERLRRVVGPRGFQKIKQAWLEDALTRGDAGEINPNRFATFYNKYRQGDNLDVMLTRKEREGLDNLYEITKTISATEKMAGNPSGTGQTMINSIYNFVRHPIYSTMTQLGARKIAKLYFQDPLFREKLIMGIKAMPDSPKAIKISSELAKYGVLSAKDKESDSDQSSKD